ncbi:hypothetical protein [Calothrix sp. CCY 0018]
MALRKTQSFTLTRSQAPPGNAHLEAEPPGMGSLPGGWEAVRARAAS